MSARVVVLCSDGIYQRHLAQRVADELDLVGVVVRQSLNAGRGLFARLARAIASEPEIIFFDEPTTGLDPIMAQVINELIVTCVEMVGATALSITHDMHSLREIGDQAAMIYQGKIVWSGEARDIDNSGNPYVDQFVHGSAEGPIRMQVRAA